MSDRTKYVLLVLWGFTFTSAVGLQASDTLAGEAVFAAALWMGFYPLAIAVGFSVGRYWAMLAVFVPCVVALRALPVPEDFGAVVTLLILAVAGCGYWLQRRTSRQQSGLSRR
jgi:uncharacterized membrane protein